MPLNFMTQPPKRSEAFSAKTLFNSFSSHSCICLPVTVPVLTVLSTGSMSYTKPLVIGIFPVWSGVERGGQNLNPLDNTISTPVIFHFNASRINVSIVFSTTKYLYNGMVL